MTIFHFNNYRCPPSVNNSIIESLSITGCFSASLFRVTTSKFSKAHSNRFQNLKSFTSSKDVSGENSFSNSKIQFSERSTIYRSKGTIRMSNSKHQVGEERREETNIVSKKRTEIGLRLEPNNIWLDIPTVLESNLGQQELQRLKNLRLLWSLQHRTTLLSQPWGIISQQRLGNGQSPYISKVSPIPLELKGVPLADSGVDITDFKSVQQKALNTKHLYDWVCYSQSQYSLNKELGQSSPDEPVLQNRKFESTKKKREQVGTVLEQSESPGALATGAKDPGVGFASTGDWGRSSQLQVGQITIVSEALFERQNILECYKKRNLLRLFFAFCDYGAKESDDRRARSLKKAVGASGFLRTSFPETLNKSSEVSPLSYSEIDNRSSSVFATLVLARMHCSRFLAKRFQFIRQFSYQLFRESSTLIVLQIFIIPYTFLFGIFYTFTSFQLSSTLTSKGYGNLPSSLTESSLQKIGVNLPNFGGGLGGCGVSGVSPRSSSDQSSGSLLYSYSIQFHSFPDELLRLSHFSSKLFILWGFLKIWKGVRPSKSTRNDYVIQTRLLTTRKNKKRFHDVEGIEKFLPVLKTLVESFKGQSSHEKRESSIGTALHKSAKPRVAKAPMRLMTHPKGYLFIGPPGTGKTLLAQAVAGEAKVNLICLSASEIQKQIDIGTRIGAIRLRNLFEQARKNTPCILFLDEIDAIGRARNESMDLKLFTEFLIQMDSFSVKDGFIVIGTTNFLSSLDSAFVRSGRFDRIIGLNYPSKQTRIAILKLYTKKQGFDNSISWNYFGEITKGFSAADLSKVVNESSLYLIEKKFIQPTQGRLSNLQSPVPLGTGALNTGVRVEQVRTSSQELTKRLFSRTIVNIFIQYLNFLVPSFFKPSRNSLVHTTSSLERGIERISNS